MRILTINSEPVHHLPYRIVGRDGRVEGANVSITAAAASFWPATSSSEGTSTDEEAPATFGRSGLPSLIGSVGLSA